METELIGLFIGAISLGLIHGVEPGHGWPVAAISALDRSRKWLWGFAASLILGIGHLISSIAVVLLFFLVKNVFNLHKFNDPVVLPGGVEIAGPIGIAAGALLIVLGIWEYAHGHSHSHVHEGKNNHDHEHTENDHSPHDHTLENVEKRGLWGIAGFAFLLGFIHEEEFEIIAMCAGSNLCIELMMSYAITVIVGIVGMTMLLIAGYHHFEERVANLEPYIPHISAAILILIGFGFITGFF